MINVPFSSAVMVYRPFWSVVAPVLVPLTRTLAPGTGKFFSSVITPVILMAATGLVTPGAVKFVGIIPAERISRAYADALFSRNNAGVTAKTAHLFNVFCKSLFFIFIYVEHLKL